MHSSHFLARIKEVAIQIGMIGLGVALCSFAKAQTRSHEYHRYQGQAPAIKRSDRRKDEFAECRNKYLKKGIPAEVFDACISGIQDAEDMAREEATRMGCEDGFYTGFAAGLYDGAEYYKNDQIEFSQGMSSGLQRAMSVLDRDAQSGGRLMGSANRAGSAKGSSDGDGDARTDWTNALDRGLPQSNPRPSSDLTFTQSEFQFPYGQLVAQPLSLEQLARERSYDVNKLGAYHDKTRRSRVCNEFRLSRRNDFRGGNYYRKDGRYSADRSRAVDGKAAFERWNKGQVTLNSRGGGRGESRSSATRQKQLQGRKIEVAAEGETAVTPNEKPAEKPANPAGTDTRGGDSRTAGNGPRGNGGATGTPAPTGTPASAPKPAVVYDLWQIYSENLQAAYAYYADDFYSLGFYDLIDDGSDVGFEAGIGAGLEYAHQQGRIAGFDREFRQQEFLSYNRAYRDEYQSQYARTFNHYRTTPVVRAQLLDVVETVKDGIFQPGEAIKAIYAIKNYGGVAANLTAQLQGAGIASSNAAPIVVPAVTSKNVADGVLTATLNPSLESLNNAQILLVVSGGEETQRSAIERQVTRQVTLDGVRYEPVAPAGVVKVTVTVKNRSPIIATSDDVKVVIADNSGNRVEPNLGTLKAGETLQPPAFELRNVDPLSIYLGRVSFTVQVFKGTQLIAKSGVIAVAPNAQTATSDLAAIFDLSVQDPAKAAQANAALEQLVAEVSEEIEDVKNSTYEKNPEGTLLNEVVKAYQKRGAQSANAKGRYREFANKIRPLSKRLTTNRLFGRKSKGEKAFLGMLDTLSQ